MDTLETRSRYGAQFPLLDYISSGIFAIDCNANIVLWNKTMELWTSTSRQHVLGGSLYELFPTTAEDAFKLRIESVLAGGPPAIFSPQLHDYLIPCPLPNDAFRSQLVTVYFLEDHQIALFSVQDHTEQVRLIERYKASAYALKLELDQRLELEKKNIQLVAAVNQAAEAIVITDQRGRIEYANQAFMQQTGWVENNKGKMNSYTDLFRKSDHQFADKLHDLFESHTVWSGRQHIPRQDGSSFIGSISIAPIVNETGMLTHHIIIQEDISQQIHVEEKIRNSQKQEALITLIGGIAHDFNNLLAALIGQVYLVSREVADMPKTLARMKKIQASAQGGAEIVKHLLTFARQGEHHAEDFQLRSFVNELTKLVRLNVPENIKLSSSFELGTVTFRGDANQLQQSLLNIVQNAVEACAKVDEPHINMSLVPFHGAEHADLLEKYPVLRHGNFAHILIRDNGIGMDEDMMSRIFDPFFSTKQLGSGLGLAMVMGCVRHHHGIIDVESRPGQGSCFHLFLPTLMPKSKVKPIADKDLTCSANILLVDDDERVLESTHELLECMGHHVTLAHNGREACSVFEKQPDYWDILITDVVMPHMDGVAASIQIRAKRPDLPIIFATGYDQSLLSDGMRQLKNVILISKPFNPDNLDRLIGKMLK